MTSANQEIENISVVIEPDLHYAQVGMEPTAGTPSKRGDIRPSCIRQLCRRCERARAWVKKCLAEVKLLEAELAESHGSVADIQRRLEVADNRSLVFERKLKKYREWWLNEYLFVRLLLQMIPDPDNVGAIAESSHSRFEAYCAEM